MEKQSSGSDSNLETYPEIHQTHQNLSDSGETQSKITKNLSPILPTGRLYFILGFALLAVSGITYRTLVKDTQPETVVAETISLPVRAMRVKIQPLQRFVFGDGRTSAIRAQHLTFETAGTVTYIKSINGRSLQEGDKVGQGELLARVDDRRLQADLLQSEAGIAEAQTQKLAAQAGVSQAEAIIEQAKADVVKATAELQASQDTRNLAASDYARRVELLSEGAVSLSDVDVYENKLQIAEVEMQAREAQLSAADSNVKSARAQLKSAKAKLAASEANIKSAIASQKRSQVNIEETVIRAPFDGIIAHINIRDGDYWTPERARVTGDDQSLVESVPIIIIDPSGYEMTTRLPAFDGALVKTGQTAYIVSDQDMSGAANSGMTEEKLFRLARAKGRVFSVSPSITPGERAISVTVRLNKGSNNIIRDGERVSVWIAVEENLKALAVPPNAIVYRQQEPHVFVIDEAKKVVAMRPVKEGIRGISLQEIKSGIKHGELVVIEGTNRLVNGTPVEVIGIRE